MKKIINLLILMIFVLNIFLLTACEIKKPLEEETKEGSIEESEISSALEDLEELYQLTEDLEEDLDFEELEELGFE